MYQYDGLYQLKDFDRGNRGTGQTIATGTLKAAQEWTFDNTGNWATFKDDSDGVSGWNLEQTREHNKANETGTIGATTGDIWADSVHDKAGNMVTVPQPGSLAYSYACKYDAWNRLVEVKDGTLVVGAYGYDGLNRRITVGIGSSGRHFYYSRDWQVVEERFGSDPESATADRQFVWGIRYVDDLILRDQDTSSTPDGVMDVQLWVVQDANFNVTAILDDAGDVLERYTYTPYGVMQAYQPDFSDILTSPSLEYRYAGYRFDGETGLYAVRYRNYHPQLGRFLRRDPRDYGSGSWNLYAYVSGRAVSAADPSGLVISICAPPSAVDEYLREEHHIEGYREQDDAGAHVIFYLPATAVVRPNQAGVSSLESETLQAMLRSPYRVFVVKGTGREAIQNLRSHVAVRTAVVRRALSASFGFPADGVKEKRGSAWQSKGDDWSFGPGTSAFDAYSQPWDSPGDYDLGCLNATTFVMKAGAADVLGRDAFNAMEGGVITPQLTVPRTDAWVPGDRGYIPNKAKSFAPGFAGENIIYVGQGQFWGHLGRDGRIVKSRKTLVEWEREVGSWNGVRTTADARRWWPTVGLENTAIGLFVPKKTK